MTIYQQQQFANLFIVSNCVYYVDIEHSLIIVVYEKISFFIVIH